MLDRIMQVAACAGALVLAAPLTSGTAWGYSYDLNALSAGDTQLMLDSSSFGGADTFNAVLRSTADAKVGVILLHGRGESYLDGHVILPLRLDLADRGYDTLSIDTALPMVNSSYPNPGNPAAYANFRYDITSGTNYVFPETFARIRAAESALQARGVSQVVIVGFSMGSRLSSNFLSHLSNNGVLPIVGYVGVGMGGDALVPRLDTPTSLKGVTLPVLDLYTTADQADVLSTASARKSKYGGAPSDYTQYQQDVSSLYTAVGDGHQWVGFESQLSALTYNWIAPLAPVPEPATASLLLIGLPLILYAARRQERAPETGRGAEAQA